MSLVRPAWIASALLTAALALAGCGDDAAPATTATTPAALDNALWPAPADADPATTPRAVARSFVEDFIHVRRPVLGAFQQGDSRSGEVPVHRRGEDGRSTGRVIATIALRRLTGSAWFVIGAFSDEVTIAAPQAMAEIDSPVTISGEAVGHEGNVILRVHRRFEPQPLVATSVIAGSSSLAPYSAGLDFDRPAAGGGAIVARAAQPLPGSDAFAAVPVRFAGPDPGDSGGGAGVTY